MAVKGGEQRINQRQRHKERQTQQARELNRWLSVIQSQIDGLRTELPWLGSMYCAVWQETLLSQFGMSDKTQI